MTNVLSHKEYQGLDGRTWFVEKYIQSEWMQQMWRYGVYNDGKPFIYSDELWSRPNLKKLNKI